MARKRFRVEQIIPLLREAEVALAKGQSVPTVCKQIGVSDKTYYRWRKEYGGMKMNQAKRLKELEQENTRLKRPNARAPLPSRLPTSAVASAKPLVALSLSLSESAPTLAVALAI